MHFRCCDILYELYAVFHVLYFCTCFLIYVGFNEINKNKIVRIKGV